MIGQYSGSASMLSTDGGASFASNSLPGSNYSFLLRDRATILAEQGGGIYKMRFAHNHNPNIAAASVAVTAPNGGESWVAGEVRNVTWNATSLAAVRIEWRENISAAWQSVADIEGYAGTYAWTVPSVATTTAEVRVRDAWDGSPTDACDGTGAGAAAWLVYRGGDGGFADEPEAWTLPALDLPIDAEEPLEQLADNWGCVNGATFRYTTVDLDGEGHLDLVVTDACDAEGTGATAWLYFPGTCG